MPRAETGRIALPTINSGGTDSDHEPSVAVKSPQLREERVGHTVEFLQRLVTHGALFDVLCDARELRPGQAPDDESFKVDPIGTVQRAHRLTPSTEACSNRDNTDVRERCRCTPAANHEPLSPAFGILTIGGSVGVPANERFIRIQRERGGAAAFDLHVPEPSGTAQGG